MHRIEQLLSQLESAIIAAFNSRVSWAIAIWACFTETVNALAISPAEGAIVGALCFGKLAVAFAELNKKDQPPQRVVQLVNRLASQFEILKGENMALTPLTNPPVCSTGKSGHKGICCTALTQLGAAVAASGFTYTSCTGKTVCMKCMIGTSTSTNPKRAGKPIFIPRRVTCGPSGCPALASQ